MSNQTGVNDESRADGQSLLNVGLCVDIDGLPDGCAIFPAGYFDEYPLEYGAVGTSTHDIYHT